MSYLSVPRLHFSGYFQADVSTVNNDVRHFDSDEFQPQYQLPQTPNEMNGWWNPEGSGAFRLVQCKVTGGTLDGKLLTRREEDPAIGMTMAGADGRVCGKLVDLDPQQQSVSEIWGLQVRLVDLLGKQLFSSDYRVAPFMDLWRRQQGSSAGDQTLASYYQSVLDHLDWSSTADSKLLGALRDSGKTLSIKFNLFGFKLDRTSPEFTLGNIVGAIGPADDDEPATFVLGRQMMATIGGNPTAAAQNIYNFPCQVHDDREVVSADFGNALPISDGQGTLRDIGALYLGVLKDDQADNGDVIPQASFESLGEVPYLAPDWYPTTAGITDFSYHGNPWLIEHVHDRPLALVRPEGADQFQVLIRESLDGLYVRAEQFVQRLDPGSSAAVDFYVTRFGTAHAGAIELSPDNSLIGGGAGPTPLDPPVEVPTVGEPAEAVSYPARIFTNEQGRATLDITALAAGPGNPRKYMDGQLYGVGFQLQGLPEGYHANPWLFVSLLVWDAFDDSIEPTWYGQIQPILQQYGDLYPIMSRHLVDLGDYQSVVEHASLLKLAFSLPVADPNSMPVTRDLSSAKRKAILEWLASAGPDGLPVKGHSVEMPRKKPASAGGRAPRPESAATEGVASKGAAPEAAATEATPLGGKSAFLASLGHETSPKPAE